MPPDISIRSMPSSESIFTTSIDSSSENPPFWKANWWLASMLILLSIALYYQCGSYGYVLDDQIVITDNSFTKKGFDGVYELLTTESMTGYFGEQKNLVEGVLGRKFSRRLLQRSFYW